MAPKLLLTGAPGSGKTTLVRATAGELDAARIAGFITEEIRERGSRVGFRAKLLHEPREATLAGVDLPPPRVGRYGVDVAAFEALVLPFLEKTPDPRLLYVLDEVGKMECLSSRFQSAVERHFASEAAVLATVPLRGTPFIERLKKRSGAELIHLWPGARDEAHRRLCEALRAIRG